MTDYRLFFCLFKVLMQHKDVIVFWCNETMTEVVIKMSSSYWESRWQQCWKVAAKLHNWSCYSGTGVSANLPFDAVMLKILKNPKTFLYQSKWVISTFLGSCKKLAYFRRLVINRPFLKLFSSVLSLTELNEDRSYIFHVFLFTHIIYNRICTCLVLNYISETTSSTLILFVPL